MPRIGGGKVGGGASGGAYPPTLAGATITRQYDPQRTTYNLTPASANRFRGAMARALSGGASARILVIGDSITYGVGASIKTKRWTSVLHAMISAQLGAAVCGTGFIPLYDYVGPVPKDTRFTGTATHDNGTGNPGPGLMGTNAYMTTGQSVVFTPGRTDLDRFIVYYYRNQYAVPNSLNVLVDGTQVGTISCQQASGGSAQIATYDIAVGTAHTLTLAATGNNGGLLLGVEGRVNGGNGGCVVSGVGYPAQPIAAAADTTQGYGPSSIQSIPQQAADLTIICHQTNDYYGTMTANTPTTIANYTTRHQAVIDACRAAGSDVMLATEFPQTDQTKPIPMTAYTAALYGLADTNNLPLVDVKARLGEWATQSALGAVQPNDHPNDRGHYDTALGVYGALQILGVGL